MIEKKYDLLTKKWVPLERKTKGRDSMMNIQEEYK